MKELKAPPINRPAMTTVVCAGQDQSLTDEENHQQLDRLNAITDNEHKTYVGDISIYITGKLLYYKRCAPGKWMAFKDIDAVKSIIAESYKAIFSCSRTWPEDMSFYKFLEETVDSVMSHIIDSYKRRKKYRKSSLDDDNKSMKLEKEAADAAGTLDIEMSLKDLAFELAFKAVGNNEKFRRLLEAMQEEPDYKSIAKKMKTTQKEVKLILDQLLKYLRNC